MVVLRSLLIDGAELMSFVAEQGVFGRVDDEGQLGSLVRL